MRYTIYILSLALIGVSLAWSPYEQEKVLLEPNPEIQLFLKGLLSANPNEMFSGNEEIFRSNLARLRELTGNDNEFLIRQLLLFSVDAKEMKDAMLPGVIIEQLNIPDSAIITGSLSFIDAGNEQQKSTAWNWLGGTDRAKDGGIDFSHYERILRERSTDKAAAIIDYMFNREPRAAVLSMARVYGDNAGEAELAATIKCDPTSVLQSLADRPEWWAHLYVATVLEKDSFLRTPELLEILEKDTNPIVQEKVSKLKEEMLPKNEGLPVKE